MRLKLETLPRLSLRVITVTPETAESMLDFPLMLQVKLPVVDRIQT